MSAGLIRVPPSCSVSRRTVSKASGSSAIRSAVRRQACITVVWLRPPNARPIAGSVWSVSSRARYMATWRGQATGAARLEESSCSSETPNASAGLLLDLAHGVRRAAA